MLLQVSNLTSGYGRTRVLNGMDFQAKRGEVLAVIGRNGVGKTTLMKTLIGLLPVMSGAIELDGETITPFTAARRARHGIGYVPQGRGIFGRMTVGENLAAGETVGSAAGSTRANYDRVFRFFPRLRERLAQKAGTMSGGEQQQLAIGRILIGEPKLVLLDEPSEGIQPNIIQEIGRIIVRLSSEEKLTVVIVEQNLELIEAAADRCLVMDKGAITAEIEPAALKDPKIAKKYLAI
ncbi:MAG: ABC transporter ATP-binding protein [Parvibaculaceae bacterium]